jgi:hypothetical protein
MRYKDQLVHENVDYKGDKGYFKSDMLHYPYDNLKQFIRKNDFYADLRARELFQKGKKFSVLNLFVNPAGIFVKMYILKKGFLDGLTGLILAMLYSAVYTLMKYIKLWELEKHA